MLSQLPNIDGKRQLGSIQTGSDDFAMLLL